MNKEQLNAELRKFEDNAGDIMAQQPKPHYQPPIVSSPDTLYYTETGDVTKQDALKQATVFSGDAVRDAWNASPLSHLQLVSTNKKYRALPKKVWDAILALHQTVHAYMPDFFDCDAFSAIFVGFTLWNFEINGVVRVFDNSADHSYNAVLISDDAGKTCRWERVEPQTDMFVDDKPPPGIVVNAPKGAYTATSGFAITA